MIIFLLLAYVTAIDLQQIANNQQLITSLASHIRNNTLDQFDYEDIENCISKKCCKCGKDFKNSTYSSIHLMIHHEKPTDQQILTQAFMDVQVPQQVKYNFCLKYFDDYPLDNFNPEKYKDLCLIISKEIYKKNHFMLIAKYFLLVSFFFIGAIYYSDLIGSLENKKKK